MTRVVRRKGINYHSKKNLPECQYGSTPGVDLKMFAKDLPESVIKRMSIRVKEARGINLGQGIPSFPTPAYVREAARRALNEQDIGVYPNFLGTIKLRQAIVEKLNREYTLRLTADSHVLVTVGAMEGTAAAILSIVKNGERVGVVTPDYCNHFPQIQLARGKIIEIPMQEGNKWQLDLSRIAKEARKGLALLIITNPNNPTGAVFDSEQIGQLVKLSNKYNFWVLADETYAFLDYEKKFASLFEFWNQSDRLISVRTFSKEYAMTGWRVGYIAARPEVIKVVAKTHDALVGCAPKISQKAAVAALTGPQQVVTDFVKILQKRRNLACEMLGKMDKFLTFSKPEGAYYIFPKYRLKVSSGELSDNILADVRLAIVPGSVFGRAGEDHLRLSFAVDEEIFEAGVEKLMKFFHNTK